MQMGLTTIEKAMGLLGYQATDKITGYTGVIDCVSFDLYGCIQAGIKPPISKEGKVESGVWFDVNRLAIFEGSRVMTPPDFANATVDPEQYAKGPAEKPPR